MKRIFFTTLIIVLGFIVSNAHEVNNYKYFCIDVDENPYDIETRFGEEFQKQGFFLMNREYYETLNARERNLVLFAEYTYYINYSGPSSITLTLRNSSGEVVWSARGEGCTLLSAKGDMKGATKNIMKSFKKLNYKFDESNLAEPDFGHPFSTWSEDSIKTYLRTKRTSQIEGIYKNYSNSGDAYNIALLKYNDKYYGIVVDTDNKLWKNGETKFVLTHIDGGAYDGEYYDYGHKKLNALCGFTDDRILQVKVPYGGNTIEFGFLRIYPSGSEPSSSSVALNPQCKATGSGIIISDYYLITNYHVIANANKIEVVLDINGVPESFTAREICSDKTNDLALLSIKDEKYQPKTNIPFRISRETIDVGTSVFTMGFPMTSILGDEIKITDGIISSKTGYDGDIVTYQISAPIQPGNSGGPLFDKKGNLVGITNAGINITVAENVGYAIKTPYVLNLIDSAPINITIPKGISLPSDNLPELIKILKPYVAFIKIY